MFVVFLFVLTILFLQTGCKQRTFRLVDVGLKYFQIWDSLRFVKTLAELPTDDTETTDETALWPPVLLDTIDSASKDTIDPHCRFQYQLLVSHCLYLAVQIERAESLVACSLYLIQTLKILLLPARLHCRLHYRPR